ncbi:MAG: hypothetical protein K9K67_05745 [Bacteriovoracaceae bacterium]|nr:hypothetical protein [Bacteriovoracaceae bacterium]
MTRERKMKVTLVLGLTGLSMLFTAGLKRSSDHNKISRDLTPKTPSICRHRKISSIAEGETTIEASLETICNNDSKIDTLKEDLEHLQKERARVVAALEKYTLEIEEEEKKKKEKKEKVEENQISQAALLNAMMFSMQTPAPQMSMPLPIITASSPFHNPSSQQLTNYLQMVMMNRLSFSMEKNNYWQPQWNAQGHLSNPIYGGPNAFQNIEDMYRNPLGQGQNPQELYHAQTPIDQRPSTPWEQQPTLFFQ